MAEEKRKAAEGLQKTSLRIMKEKLGSREEELQRAEEILEESRKSKAQGTRPKEIILDEEEEVAQEGPVSAPFQTKGKKKTPPKP